MFLIGPDLKNYAKYTEKTKLSETKIKTDSNKTSSNVAFFPSFVISLITDFGISVKINFTGMSRITSNQMNPLVFVLAQIQFGLA